MLLHPLSHVLTSVSVASSSTWDTTSGDFSMQPVEGEAFDVDMLGYKPSSAPSRSAILSDRCVSYKD